MKTLVFKGVHNGDWVRCCDCGAQMLLPTGAERCPVCGSEGCLQWVNENVKEIDNEFELPEIERTGRELQPQDYLEVETLEQEHPELYKELMGCAIGHTDFYYVYKYLHQIEYDELCAALVAHGGSWEFGGYCNDYDELLEQDRPIIAVSGTKFTANPFDAAINKVWLDDAGVMRFDAEDNDSGCKVEFNWEDVFPGHLSYLTAEIPPVKGMRTVSKNRQVTLTVRNGKVNITDNED